MHYLPDHWFRTAHVTCAPVFLILSLNRMPIPAPRNYCSYPHSQQTQNISITFVQRRPGPTLYKCYTNVLCLLGCDSSYYTYILYQYAW